MAKGKSRKIRDDNVSSTSGKQVKRSSTSNANASSGGGGGKQGASNHNEADSSLQPSSLSSNVGRTQRSLCQWCVQERQGLLWVLGCAFIGGLLGFGIGSGILTGETGPPNAWRRALGAKIRSTLTYRILTFQTMPWDPMVQIWRNLVESSDMYRNREDFPISFRNDPSHPRVFAVLREAVVREVGGYVHPDLGLLVPAPCGAARGLGMVRDSYHKCQTSCIPGVAAEKLAAKKSEQGPKHGDDRKSQTSKLEAFFKNATAKVEEPKVYKQEEVLVKVPLSFQMTRAVALETLLPRISAEVQRRASLHELDDAALLVLLLAHERGVGRYSRWLPYIASLPSEPSCGYSQNLRPYMLDSINALRDELGLDVNGWPGELLKATQYADRIANGLARDYGSFLQHPKGVSVQENIAWSLCQVASRATGGSEKHGALRLIPILDMVNHDADAGGFVELTGTERLDDGDFIDASEDDSGAFVIRSLRHGRRKALRKGQELLANYNVPLYSPLDWFVSLGFVPPERWNRWQKIDSALPRIRRDGPFSDEMMSPGDLWKEYSPEL